MHEHKVIAMPDQRGLHAPQQQSESENEHLEAANQGEENAVGHGHARGKSRPNIREEWIDRMARYRASGFTIERFCKQENYTSGTFYYWKKRLDKANELAGSESFEPAPANPALMQKQSAAAYSDSKPLEIELPNGAIIRMSGDVSESQIAMVLRAAGSVAAS